MNEMEKWQKELKGRLKNQFNKLSEVEKQQNFASTLCFGTAGVRAIMSIGTACINEITITRIIAGFCEFLGKNSEKTVLIAFDTRKNSKKYGFLAQKILQNYKIKSVLFRKPTPTSVLAYSVKKQNFDYGIMITSSHNPKEYNGIKIVAKNGGQISDETANLISKKMTDVDDIKLYYSLAKIKHIFAPKKYKRDFLKMCYGIGFQKSIEPSISVCYTPLNGTALSYAKNILNHFGYAYSVPPSQKRGNGKFKTCPYPNPEFRVVYDECFKWDEEKSDIYIANDPDGDRIGIMAKYQGKLKLMTGNQLGLVILNYLIKHNSPENSFMVSTVVSTPLAKKLCEVSGVDSYFVLTGFKNITEKIESIDDKQLIFAFEESCGYIVCDELRDKDGLSALALICEIANYYDKKHMTLFDALYQIYEKIGYEENLGESIKFEGSDAIKKMNAVVSKIREMQELKDVAIVTDYLKTEKTHLAPSNFLGFDYPYGKLFIRPSGTEPKLKLYVYGSGNTTEEAKLNCEKILAQAKQLIASSIY